MQVSGNVVRMGPSAQCPLTPLFFNKVNYPKNSGGVQKCRMPLLLVLTRVAGVPDSRKSISTKTHLNPLRDVFWKGFGLWEKAGVIRCNVFLMLTSQRK